ncbi:unnamed protein product [Adineta steineri]|uniref:Clathrin/coatomer adaptor adaptin-like N-terminal domain-containing protein n=2 Tax=Adineta steineri TaxID=433720 RepID=A0A814QCX3_9BILA|nr:unnamed protein product [Adineta steineri]
MGILKSFNKQGINTQIETDKDHYFVHLSFQEYFTARYLIKALKEHSVHQEEIKFIQREKYNQRYAVVFTFLSGLFSEADTNTCLNIFWDLILTPPIDLVGIRHMQLVISCIEETSNQSTIPQHTILLGWIAKCIERSLSTENKIIRKCLAQSLRRAPSVVCSQTVINAIIHLLQNNDSNIRTTVLSFISKINNSDLAVGLVNLVTIALDDKDAMVRYNAYQAFGNIGRKAATNQVINTLVSALQGEISSVISNTSGAVGTVDRKAATNEAIAKLISALEHENEWMRENVCQALGNIGEKAATNEVINKLVGALEDYSVSVRSSACQALGNIGEKVATNEVINKLVNALEDEIAIVRSSACRALGKIGAKAAMNEVITKLVNTLEDNSDDVRWDCCSALGNIGEIAATNEVITKLVSTLEDKSEWVRSSACKALGKMGEKATTNEVITKLVSALEDQSERVRVSTCQAFGDFGEKAATNEVITKLVNALEDKSEWVRSSACGALGKMGEKTATNEVITKLVNRRDADGQLSSEAAYAIDDIFRLSAVMIAFGPLLILKLCGSGRPLDCLKNVSLDELIRKFFDTQDADWLLTAIEITLRKSAAVSINEDKLMVYDNGEPIELRVPNLKLQNELIEAFTKKAKALHLSFGHPQIYETNVS